MNEAHAGESLGLGGFIEFVVWECVGFVAETTYMCGGRLDLLKSMVTSYRECAQITQSEHIP